MNSQLVSLAVPGSATWKHDVEADFFLLSTCNFRCKYCFVPQSALAAPIHRYAENEEWERAFNEGGRRWLIHVSGGEPFAYPQFNDLCQRLTRRHLLSINSNLSNTSVEEFAEVIDPKRVDFINAAIHLEQRLQRRSSPVDVFARRVVRLRNQGFAVFVSLVMSPPMFRAFSGLRKQLEPFGITVILRGHYGEVLYPDGYTWLQRAAFRRWSRQAKRSYADMIRQMPEAPTIDLFSDQQMLRRVPSFLGQSCASGQKLVRIEPDGRVMRCSSGECLGNLLEGTVRLLDGPKACDTSYCPYFCQKYTAPRYAACNQRLSCP